MHPSACLMGACWPISCPVTWTTGRPETQCGFAVSPHYFHFSEKHCTIFPGTEKESCGSGNERFPCKACLWWWCSQCVISGAKSLTLDHLQSLIHHDLSPVTLLFCRVKSLCTQCTLSPLGWLAGWLQLTGWCWTVSSHTAPDVIWKPIFIKKKEASAVH